ncbi:VPLPA-CTERM sorting domain-containing protein [Pacificoceanicola onchidii]|uniref:VPLPA-CTERM sorting domain-containing protein n=1 Tax=Pacificoceanicola onchidii TaxID=2562685 RepID=UPI0010A605BC|nr:VPLPA-CTERM sorting domain-containing protein [Pacificoceanicola onchidii]
MKLLKSVAIAAVLSLSSVAAQAATLVGTGNFATTGDLTIVDDGGTILEFLDYTSTQGMTVTTALSTFGSAGFTLVNGSQMSALFDAFGMIYDFLPGGVLDMTTPGYVTPTESSAFTSYLGTTFEDAAILTFASEKAVSGYGFLCTSPSGSACGPDTHIADTAHHIGQFYSGIALVRASAVAPVPLPAGGLLLLTGLAGLGLARKRRQMRG